MGKKVEQTKPSLKKGDRFTAYDEKARCVRGVVLDVLPWSKWPLKCDVTVDGIRQIIQYNADELGAVIIINQGGSPMIRPLHLILNGKTLSAITAPIDGKVAELEDFARRKETEAAALAHNSAMEFEVAKARFAQQQDIAGVLVVEARTATRIADKLRKVVA